jgi:mycofactocin system creatininase family protein
MDGELRSATWPTVSRGCTVLVPVGSIEQHGPHLPLDTDSVIAAAVAERVAASLTEGQPSAGRFVVAPTVVYGASGEHQSFAGTSSIGSDVLRLLIVELVRSMRTWARRLILVNGHGGNAAALSSAVRTLLAEGHEVSWHACKGRAVDAHAGYSETSLMLHLDPGRVRRDLMVPGNTRPLAALMPAMREAGVEAVAPNGVLGDPVGATPEEGERVLSAMVRAMVVDVLEAGLVATS